MINIGVMPVLLSARRVASITAAQTQPSMTLPESWGAAGIVGPRADTDCLPLSVGPASSSHSLSSQHSGVDPRGQRRRRRATLPTGSRLVEDDKLEPDAEGDVGMAFIQFG
jgi:hypothetical protein